MSWRLFFALIVALLRVAKGEEAGQPAAADMRTLVWDDELEAIAQRWSTKENNLRSCESIFELLNFELWNSDGQISARLNTTVCEHCSTGLGFGKNIWFVTNRINSLFQIIMDLWLPQRWFTAQVNRVRIRLVKTSTNRSALQRQTKTDLTLLLMPQFRWTILIVTE